MIDLLWFYLKLGFWHVLDLEGLDHLYFIITLAIPYTFRQGKKLLWWVTLFTLGHTISLIGNFYADIPISSYWVELLIPITIALNSIPLIITKSQNRSFHKGYFLSSTTVIFGIIHGLGFGRYFKMLITDENVSFSLFSFALGVEFAQIVILFNVLVISLIVVNILKQERNRWQLLVGALIISQAISMIFERI
tara:strand:- start:391 stop:969 length:579 start_codon:yes stop_codon:yes gene_type:complete